LVFIFSRSNSFHHAAFSNSSNTLVGGIYEFSSNVSGYFSLEERSDQLVHENARLKEKLYGHSIKIGESFTTVNDTLYKTQYKFVTAEVVNSTKKLRKNFVTINKGKANRVGPDMGVVGPNGIVGLVVSSSPYYATVIPVINEDFIVSVRHQKSKSDGQLVWTEDNDWQTATMIDVAIYAEINKGDIIETKGSGGYFPAGQMVGTVISAKDLPGTTYQEITIKLAEDFGSSYDVYVIENELRTEQKELEAEF